MVPAKRPDAQAEPAARNLVRHRKMITSTPNSARQAADEASSNGAPVRGLYRLYGTVILLRYGPSQSIGRGRFLVIPALLTFNLNGLFSPAMLMR